MDPQPHVPRFDFALSLAGAVSGGAYSAGVVDFLVEALDALQAARDRGDPQAPRHVAVLCAVVGASSGSLTAAVLTSALQYDFPHVRSETPAVLAACNPLYDSWVEMTGIEHLLGTADGDDEPVRSLLDASNLQVVARKAVDYGTGIALKQRRWLSAPLHLAFTVANLRGVPFALTRRTSSASPVQTLHADVMRFAITNFGPHPARGRMPDERPLHFSNEPLGKWNSGGEELAAAALASAAFPVALRPVTLRRPTADYDHRTFTTSTASGEARTLRALKPSWSPENPDPGPTFQFAAVDGGVMNNSPVDLSLALLGDGEESRDMPGDGAKRARAVLMVDPLSGPPTAGPRDAERLGIAGVVGPMLRSLIEQANFRPAELALAADPNVYSRFLIAPMRDGPGARARGRDLAGSFLGGFGGYFSVAFRRHDFLLGRCNAQRYLAETFSLPAEHPLFAAWTPAQREHHAVPGAKELPIIPLVDGLHPKRHVESMPAWPAGAADLALLPAMLDRRLDLIYRSALHASWWRYPLYPLWRWGVRPRVRRAAVSAVADAMRSHGLL